MSDLDIFNEFFDDVMIQKMSVHAFGMYAKGLVMNLQATIEAQEIIIKDKSKHIEQIESYTDISYIKAGVFNSKPKVQP